MSNSINFTGVKTAEGGNFCDPGVIGIFECTKVEYVPAKDDKNPFINIYFENQEHGNHRERYALSEAALPRLKYVIEAYSGGAVDGDLEIAKINDACKGKKQAMKVGGGVSNKGKGFAELAWADYCAPPTEEGLASLKFSAKELGQIEAAKAAIANAPKAATTVPAEESIDAPDDLEEEV